MPKKTEWTKIQNAEDIRFRCPYCELQMRRPVRDILAVATFACSKCGDKSFKVQLAYTVKPLDEVN